MGIMLLVIMEKLCKRKVFNPCFRVGMTIDSEICFQFLVEALSLSIGLRVISGRQCNGVIKKLSKGSREFGNELGTTIRDDLIVESKSLINVFEEKFGHSFSGDRFQAWSNNYPLRKAMVYHDHDRVKTSRRRKISDEIDRKKSEGYSCSRGDWNEGWSHRVRIRFHLLA
jgi:hypothetical protein